MHLGPHLQWQFCDSCQVSTVSIFDGLANDQMLLTQLLVFLECLYGDPGFPKALDLVFSRGIFLQMLALHLLLCQLRAS